VAVDMLIMLYLEAFDGINIFQNEKTTRLYKGTDLKGLQKL
jgi:hypothetical protein